MATTNLDDQLSRLRIDQDRKRSKRRGLGRWIWILLFILGAAGAGYVVYDRLNAPLPVRSTRIELEKTEPGKGPALVTASGYVIPRHKVEISAKIIGRIKEVLVQRGDHVKQGDVLLRIDDEEHQARLRAAEAQVASIKARLAELRTGARPQEIEAAKAAVDASEASVRSARLDLQRIGPLAQRGVVAKQELDRIQAAADVAQARLDADRKNAELVKLGPRKEQIEATEALLQQAGHNEELAKVELDYTVITAPISGTILEKLAEQGELVTNMNFGGTRGAKNSVVTMADLTDLQVEVDLNESDVAKVKPGQQTEIRLDSEPLQVYAGSVDEVSPQADRQKGTVQAKVRLIAPDESVRTEVNARVTFLGDAPDPAAPTQARIWIPKSALTQGSQGASVFVLVNGRALARPVKTGIDGEKGVEITKGLSEGETVILAPLEKLTNGLRVAAIP